MLPVGCPSASPPQHSAAAAILIISVAASPLFQSQPPSCCSPASTHLLLRHGQAPCVGLCLCFSAYARCMLLYSSRTAREVGGVGGCGWGDDMVVKAAEQV